MGASSTGETAALHNETLTDRSECRALVALEPHVPAPRAAGRPDAGFLTQMIACARRLPAYRERRRAEPAEGAARYGAAPQREGRPALARSV
jgi:hypothetical protein